MWFGKIHDTLANETRWNEHQLVIMEGRPMPGFTCDSRKVLYTVVKLRVVTSLVGVPTLQIGRGERFP